MRVPEQPPLEVEMTMVDHVPVSLPHPLRIVYSNTHPHRSTVLFIWRDAECGYGSYEQLVRGQITYNELTLRMQFIERIDP